MAFKVAPLKSSSIFQVPSAAIFSFQEELRSKLAEQREANKRDYSSKVTTFVNIVASKNKIFFLLLLLFG